jgi:DNA-binding NarL/FixJ family response regulator
MATAGGLGNVTTGAGIKKMQLFVVDPHTIYRRGLVACLQMLPEIEAVGDASSPERAWESPAFLSADLVLIDHAMAGGSEFVSAVAANTTARVVVCSSACSEEDVLGALQSGAVGLLRKDTLTTESLASAVRAALDGTGVVTSDVLRELLDGLGPDGPAKPTAARLTDREQQVLALIAAGHPTREVAQRLCYSERTVKNVLHDIVTKLGARSRSQAVAHAVREGLI